MNARKSPSRLKQVSPKRVVEAKISSPQPVESDRPSAILLQQTLAFWRWLRAHGKLRIQPKSRRLRVSETVSLGEKRFVSIVEVDGTSFLIGGGSGNVSLLTQLAEVKAPTPFQQAVSDAWQERESA